MDHSAPQSHSSSPQPENGTTGRDGTRTRARRAVSIHGSVDRMARIASCALGQVVPTQPPLRTYVYTRLALCAPRWRSQRTYQPFRGLARASVDLKARHVVWSTRLLASPARGFRREPPPCLVSLGRGELGMGQRRIDVDEHERRPGAARRAYWGATATTWTRPPTPWHRAELPVARWP